MKPIPFICALFFAVLTLVPVSHAQLRKANRALDRGELEEAMNLAQELLTEKPDDYKTWDLLARIYDTQAAQSTMEEYLAHVTEMVDSYGKVTDLRPKEKENVTNRLQIFYMQTFNQGIEEFNVAQSIVDDEALQADHFRHSARRFQASAIAFPDSAGSYVNWAYALLGAGDSEAAIEPLSLALKYGGPELELYNFLARIYLTTDRAQEAIPVLEEGSKHFPEDPEIQNYLLNAYTETGQTERALERYADAVSTDPTNALYRYNYGSLLLQSERFDEAIDQLGEAVQLDPAYVDAYYNLGAAYINQANTVQGEISSMDDDMRERREEISDEEELAIMDQIDILADQRRALYQESILPLEEAKKLAELMEGRSVMEICAALFQAYAQTGQEDKAMSVNECAGM